MVVGSLTLAAAPAQALSSVLNESAKFAVNVPSSVLSASGGSGTAEALLANAQRFNFDLADARYAAVSGTLTASPAPAASVLAPADYAAFSAATATFDAPAMAATTVAKVIPGAEALPCSRFRLGCWSDPLVRASLGSRTTKFACNRTPYSPLRLGSSTA